MNETPPTSTGAPAPTSAPPEAPPAGNAAAGTTPPPAEKPAGTSDTTQGTKPGTPEGGKAEANTAAPAELAVRLPDGVEADVVLLDKFKPLAKELGLKSDGAQKLVDLALEMQGRWQQKGQEQWANVQKAWLEQAKADKEFGGAKFDASVELANKALRRFGGEELAKELQALGLQHHPGFLRAFYRVSQAIQEDSVEGKLNGSSAPDGAFRAVDLYPSMQPKQQ